MIVLDDPPFYLKHITSSYPESAHAIQSDQSSYGQITLDMRNTPGEPTRSQMGSSKSNGEAFRDVIDDLTIQNKRLRKRLKKYETLHCSHLQQEKLFEVKFHGLPAHKKRELDDFLRGFAVSVEKLPNIHTLSASRQQSLSLPDPLPLLSSKKPSSSTTSNSKPVDSAYASMSMSGQSQSSYSHLNDKGKIKQPVSTTQSKQENVKTYLDDMPKGLMPKHSLVMSERSKRKLVVRRLEEIYTGKGAASSAHGQSHQQQEVSQSAAKADRSALEAGGRRARMEGVREARMSTVDADVLTEHMSGAHLTSRKTTNDGDESTSRNPHSSQDGTPDQRPTRPLDLDMYRAQEPADNIQYIQHLGLASPTLKTDPYTNISAGWVYLNLLINMAQLHTFNVTPEFVRKSVAELSTKFELSADGRKIRWKGGNEGSKIACDSDSSADEATGTSLEDVHSGNNLRKLERGNPKNSGRDMITDLLDVSQYSNTKSSPIDGGSTKLRPIYLEQVNDAPKFFYEPLFYHGTSSEDGEDHPYNSGDVNDRVDDDMGVERTPQRGDRMRLTRDDQGENGPVIYYNKAKFCTDLSRDLVANDTIRTLYSRCSLEPVGSGRDPQCPDIITEDTKGPLTERLFEEQMDLDDEKNATEPLLIFPGTDYHNNQSSHVVEISMEASGLSGVRPEDHFSIEIWAQHTKTNEPNSRDISAQATTRVHPNRLFQRAFSSTVRPTIPLIKSTIISTNATTLPPSSLPSPSYIDAQASSSENSENCNEDELISESHSGRRALPSSTAVDGERSAQPVSSLSSFEGTKEESSYNSSSTAESEDSSIDLLAHARELDPETIAAREREFDRNAGQQLVELPAGSSAATAGGGSGYASEDSTIDEGGQSSQDSVSSAARKISSLERDRSDRGSSGADATF